jgi:hypothetical protein
MKNENYKIRITAENQAIVKRIANENGMNPTKFEIDLFGEYYGIKNNKIQLPSLVESDDTEITTEQFIEMFDKKEKLSYTEAAKKEERITNAEIIKSMNNPTEWQPKRGDRVLVWDNDEKLAEEIIFLAEIKGSEYPIITVHNADKKRFIIGETFSILTYKHMKPLQAEQPIEIDFKTKVVELIEKRIAICIESIEMYKKLNSFSSCEIWRNCKHENQELLKQIKEL